jgi:cytochrome c biogenesis protein CcmG/thiol:disulfide interchange protein DsbE
MQKGGWFWAVLVGAAVVVALVVWGISDSETDDTGPPVSELSIDEATAPLENASPKLTALREQANQILDGGLDAFRGRLRELQGIPVVVNKWASWCLPCRAEFPMLQRQAIAHEDDVAFVGLLSDDGPDSGSTFLGELPLPYPSYLDPDKEIANAYDAGREFPSTLFIGRDGKVAFTKYGPYTSEDDLAADIDRYAQ